MIILTIRTDKPEAEIGLFEGREKLAYREWQAHRQLAETINKKIESLLKSHKKTWVDIEGIVCFKGPGSFTGLRIGMTVMNTLADSLELPIVGTTGEDWREVALTRLENGEDDRLVMPEYGGTANITKPRK